MITTTVLVLKTTVMQSCCSAGEACYNPWPKPPETELGKMVPRRGAASSCSSRCNGLSRRVPWSKVPPYSMLSLDEIMSSAQSADSGEEWGKPLQSGEKPVALCTLSSSTSAGLRFTFLVQLPFATGSTEFEYSHTPS